MNKIIIFFENITDREKKLLILSVYAVIFIFGYYLVDLAFKKQHKMEKKLEIEKEKYIQLKKLIIEYKSISKFGINHKFSLSDIDILAEKTNIKQNIVSIKPIGESKLEIMIEKAKPQNFLEFIKEVKKQHIRITFIKIEKIKDYINARLVLEE